jgi:hypothetical protein
LARGNASFAALDLGLIVAQLAPGLKSFDASMSANDKDQIMGQIVYGRAIASHKNDGGVDLAPNSNLQAETVLSIGCMPF